MNILNRRGLLRLIGGGVAAGATVDPKQVIKEVAAQRGHDGAFEPVSYGMSVKCDEFEPQTSGVCSDVRPDRDLIDNLMTNLYDRSDAMSSAMNQMPPHIFSKKSWSPAFKVSEAYKEALAEKRAMHELRRNRTLAEKVAKKLGFG